MGYKDIEHIFGMRNNSFKQKFAGINCTRLKISNTAENIRAVPCAMIGRTACDKDHLFNPLRNINQDFLIIADIRIYKVFKDF